MLNWKAAVVGTMCFATIPTYSFMFSAIVMASLFLPRKFFYLADGWAYDQYHRMVLFFYHSLPRNRLILYGDVDALRSRKENALCIANHQTGVDCATMDMLCAFQGDIGRMRFIIKDQIRLLPIVGGYLRARGCVYVKRGQTKREGAFDEAYAVRQLDRLRTDQVPLWLVVFPEGTRYSPLKRADIERSQCFARANGFAVCDEVLSPRSKAVYLALRSLGPHLDAVYDFTIAYSATVPSASAGAKPNGLMHELHLLSSTDANSNASASHAADLRANSVNARSMSLRRLNAPGIFEHFMRPSDIHVHVSRIPIADVPDPSLGEEAVRKWLHERFVLKEQMMKKFLYGDEKTCGRFGDGGVQVRIPLSHTAVSVAMWTGLNSLFLYSASGRYTYAAGGALASAIGYTYVLATG